MKINKSEKGKGNARYRLTNDEVNVLKKYRRIKEEADYKVSILMTFIQVGLNKTFF